MLTALHYKPLYNINRSKKWGIKYTSRVLFILIFQMFFLLPAAWFQRKCLIHLWHLQIILFAHLYPIYPRNVGQGSWVWSMDLLYFVEVVRKVICLSILIVGNWIGALGLGRQAVLYQDLCPELQPLDSMTHYGFLEVCTNSEFLTNLAFCCFFTKTHQLSKIQNSGSILCQSIL